MAGGELIRHLARYDDVRAERAAFVSSVAPLALAGLDSPEGIDPALIEAVRAMWRRDFSRWIEDGAASTGPRWRHWRQEMRTVAVPTLLIHGDADASIPLELSSRRTVGLIANSRLEVYEKAGHGLYVTRRARLSADLVDFCRETP